MNTLFEVKYKCTEEVYKKIYKYIYFHNNLTYGIIAFYMFWIVLVNSLNMRTGKGIDIKSIVSLVAIFGFLFLYSNVAAKRRYKNDLSSNKYIPTISNFLVREDAFVVKLSNAAAEPVPYNEIIKVKNTKDFYILSRKNKVGYYVMKDSFAKGTTEEFEAFLKDRGYKF